MSQFAATLAEARAKLPLRRLMEQHGKGPTSGQWGKNFGCPWCTHKSAGVFKPESSTAPEMFKCQHIPCPTNNIAFEEIGFLEFELGLANAEAWKVYFKEAGVWKDAEDYAASIMPGFAARKKPPLSPSTENEQMVQEAIEVIRAEWKASATLLQRRLRIGYNRAASLIAELERRGIVGPARGVEPREILNLPAKENLPSLESPATASAPTEPSPALEESGATPGGKVVPSVPAAADVNAASDGPPPVPETAPLSTGEPPSPAVAALRWFYEKLTLVESDLALLWKKRGLTADTCAALGYKSNLKANKELLLEMQNHFPPLVLLDSGLWSQGEKPADPPKPNPQFYGMSLVERRDAKTGKKIRDDEDEVIVDCVWGDPGAILIPYFDAAGDLIHLRPHKGMMRGKTPRLYVARPSRAWRAAHLLTPAPALKYAVTTEGEFKAAGIWQTLGDECGVAAVPGITMAKMLFGDIEEWLEEIAVPQVVIAYDNEDKSNPKLPGYQEDKWKRFDAQIWARYLAARLLKEGYDGKVCVLPDEWRDELGKADWDGQLARMLDEEFARRSADGKEVGGAELWAASRPAVRAAFTGALRAAVAVREMWQARLFDSEEERIIKNGVEKISFERALPIGGDDEETIARRLQRLVARLKRDGDKISPKARGFLSLLAKKYLDVKGGYYICKKLQQKQDDLWHTYSDKASNTGDADLKRACEIALKGIPERVSDFFMRAHYVLRKLDGTRVRLVTLHNIHGVKTGLVPLPSTPFAQPSKFREWLLDNISGAAWSAGERELNALQSDIGRDVAFKEVNEVAVRGYHEDSGCSFFGDVTYDRNDKELFADKSGIIWVRGDGGTEAYKLAERDHEGQNFCQRTPLMRVPIYREGKLIYGHVGSDEETAQLFQEALVALNQTLGGTTGCLALGAVLAYGAAPEIYKKYNAFPGLWLHGETNQGKSSVARWLMRIWGFEVDSGMPLADSTKVGISIAMQQYGNLPVFLEEWQPDAPKWMVEKIKNLFNRESGIKKTFDEGERRILAGAIVTGIATCTDAQVKSRYAHVQVSAKHREAEHYNWFEDNCAQFFLIGRHLLRNRKKFGALTLAKMSEWMKLPEVAQIDQRARIVHGASYGALAAMIELLAIPEEKQLVLLTQVLTHYREFLLRHATEAVQAVREKVNVNLFWRDLLDALSSDAFGETGSDLLNIFHLQEITPPKSPVTPEQLAAGQEQSWCAWKSYRLSFLPGPVIEKLKAHKRRSGGDLPLDRSDLRTQMQVRPYWVPPPPGNKGHQKKFGRGSRVPQVCWCIDVDKHELGFQAVTDDEFKDSLYRDKEKGTFLTGEEWADPRQGDLFKLIELLVKAKAKSDEPPMI